VCDLDIENFPADFQQTKIWWQNQPSAAWGLVPSWVVGLEKNVSDKTYFVLSSGQTFINELCSTVPIVCHTTTYLPMCYKLFSALSKCLHVTTQTSSCGSLVMVVFWCQRSFQFLTPNWGTICTWGKENTRLWTNKLLYRRNITKQIRSFYERQIGSRMCCIKRWHCQWPWVTPLTPNRP